MRALSTLDQPGDARQCPACKHDADRHVRHGTFTAPEHLRGADTPVAGWTTCPDCDCWGSWAISNPAMSDELRSVIEAYLDRLYLERFRPLLGLGDDVPL